MLANLAKEGFPEVEMWEVRIEGRERQLDIATVSFLALMRYLKKVILQDSVLLMDQFPSCPSLEAPFVQL